jgi:hypothetical protein
MPLINEAMLKRLGWRTVGKLCVSVRPIVNQKVANAKKIVITTESLDVFTLRIVGGGAFGCCGKCGKELAMLTFDQPMSISGLKIGELVRRAETEATDAIGTGSGHLLICLASIAAIKDGSKMEKEK